MREGRRASGVGSKGWGKPPSQVGSCLELWHFSGLTLKSPSLCLSEYPAQAHPPLLSPKALVHGQFANLCVPHLFVPLVFLHSRSLCNLSIHLSQLLSNPWLPSSTGEYSGKNMSFFGGCALRGWWEAPLPSFTLDRLVPTSALIAYHFSLSCAAKPQGHLISHSPEALWKLRGWSP